MVEVYFMLHEVNFMLYLGLLMDRVKSQFLAQCVTDALAVIRDWDGVSPPHLAASVEEMLVPLMRNPRISPDARQHLDHILAILDNFPGRGSEPDIRRELEQRCTALITRLTPETAASPNN